MSLPIINNLAERAKRTGGCLEWLDVCGAECCKTMSFIINNPAMIESFRGKKLKLYVPPMTEDTIRYYRYHGIRVWGNSTLHLQLNDFVIKDNRLIVYKRCVKLSKENRCLVHDEKPGVCKELNKNTCTESRFYLTPNCLYKYQREDTS